MQTKEDREPDGLNAAYLKHVFADKISKDDEYFEDELVESVLMSDGMSVIYGDSNSGKTFLAIDLACSIARGCEWLGRQTTQGAVLYLATEGPRSVQMRIKAYKKYHEVDSFPFVVVTSPVNFFEGGAEDSNKVVMLIKKVESELGQKIRIVIGDTMARIAAGANENTGQDMTIVLQHADYIRENAGIHFMWIHHCGKDASKGGRGWSGIRAAIDTEIEIAEAKGQKERSIEITKQRDIDGKGDRYGFTLLPIHVGYNQWFNSRTSCVVLEAEPPVKAPSVSYSPIEQAILEYFSEDRESAYRKQLVSHVIKNVDNKGAPPKEGSVYNRINTMINEGSLIFDGEKIRPVLTHPDFTFVIS